MVRKSILVYDLLRTEQPQEGFTEREIVDHISCKHDIAPGKGLRRQVAVALRRGLDFGIIAKKKNKFRFDPDNAKAITTRTKRGASSKRSQGKKKNVKRATKTKQRRSNTERNKTSKRNRPERQPKPPKSWTPNRKYLANEPVSKVKKI